MKILPILISIALLFSPILIFSQENKLDASGKKQGSWVKLNPKTKKKIYEGQFTNNQPTGLFNYYFENGKLKAQTTYSDNGKKAHSLLFDKQGNKIAEGIYYNQIKDSIWNYYNPENTLISQESYLNGKKNGAWKVFYESGKLFEESNWKNGIKEGAWKQFYKNANPS